MERVEIVGGGPAGLLLAILLRRDGTARRLRVHDPVRPEDTHGWAVVFPGGALDELAAAAPDVHATLENTGLEWTAVDIRHGGHRRTVEGRRFRGMARSRLVTVLDRAAADAGVERVHGRSLGLADLRAEGALEGADLVVGADGVGSVVRRHVEEQVRPRVSESAASFRWLGVDRVFPAFTYVFEETPWGLLQAYVYPSGETWSSLIVQVDDTLLRGSGLDAMSDDKTAAFLSEMLAEPLEGAAVLVGRSRWSRFRSLDCATWHHDRTVLIGDAAHTAHWSIGSGTRLALGDAVALAHELGRRGAAPLDVREALGAYETARRPVVARYRAAAAASEHYFANVHAQLGLAPVQFAYQLLTRSWRITHDDVRRADPRFAAEVERWFGVTGRDPRPSRAPWRRGRLDLGHRLLAPWSRSEVSGGVRVTRIVPADAAPVGGPSIVLVDLTGEALPEILAEGRHHDVKTQVDRRSSGTAIGVLIVAPAHGAVDELVELAGALEDAGADLLVVVADDTDGVVRSALVQATAAVRFRSGLTVAVAGVASDRDQADTVIASGWADLCVIDPDPTEEVDP